jgi:Spy/CpxP family protein refolding chaperone
MKKHKIFGIFTFILAVILISQSSFGQEKFKKTPEERAQHKTDKMTKHLSLTDDQQKQVYDILYNQATQMDALRGNQEMTKEARKEQKKAIWSDTDSKLSGVFNTEQIEKWNKFKEKKKQKHMNKKSSKKHNKGNKKQK